MSSFYNIPSATIAETSLRPPSPLTVPNIHNDEEESINSPPISCWSPNASIASCEDMVDDELYIRRVFSFDEWEYDHPQQHTSPPLHREPISSNDLNRYQDSLKTLLVLPPRTTTPSSTTPSLFQDIWQKRLEHEELGHRTCSFSTVSTSPETPIPSPESAFRQFQRKVPTPLDTTSPFLPSTVPPQCPSIPRESSEASFVQIDWNNHDSSSHGIPQPRHSWSIPEYVLVSPHQSMEEEEEVEL